ncbi:MAG: AgmX/PglI C-terminal domain-containing protein [Myxococcales bacterium]|nr:AgmX/PglI C-terminal domain-containing protein [Myxococcales bacterium]
MRELQVIDEMLEELSTERQQHALVQEACGALEKLNELGGAELFWGDRPADGNGGSHIGMVRQRVDQFERRISDIESSRQSLLDRIRRQQENTEYLEDDLDEAQQQEELRKLEWVVEREIGPLPDCEPVMPWSRGGEDDQRFRKSLAAALLLALLLALLVPMVDLPVPERWETSDVPERLTRLLKEETPLPPPPVQQQLTPEEKLADAPDEEPVLAEESTPEPTPEPKPKQSVGSKGILAFREKFSSLADSRPAARLGAQARIDRSGEAAIGQQGRSLVATQAPGTSGGINLASLSRDAVGGGGQEIEGVEVGRATSSIGGVAGSDRPLSGGPGLGRTDEEIQIVFDRHKGALYRLYNRELRRDPTLKGQIVLRITIEPDGSVSFCELQASDMDAPRLSAQVVGRVKAFDFGAKKGIPAITILYPIDFLPAT